MIANLNFSLFQGNHLVDFAVNTVSRIEERGAQYDAIEPYLGNLKQRITDYQKALEKESENDLYRQQIECDEGRDTSFTAFKCFCESVEARRREPESSSAKEILSVIRKYNWCIQTRGAKMKSTAYTNIISEIKHKYNQELKSIKANELLDELAEAQIEYETTLHLFVDSRLIQKESVANELRTELVMALNALFFSVCLQRISTPCNQLSALIDSLNELIVISLA